MNTKPEVSDEELRGYMNFDELLERRKAAVRKMKNVDVVRKGVILSAAVITLSVVWFIHRGGAGEDRVVQDARETRHGLPDANEPAHAPLPQDSAQTDLPQEPPLPAHSVADERTGASKKASRLPDRSPETTSQETDLPALNNSSTAEYQYSEAEPVDGFPALYDYFNNELVYPREAIRDSIQGVVTAFFVIGVNGAPENIRIENSLGELFDEEVKRLIENMPSWRPATVNGKPVPSRLSIPVTFQLEKVRNK